MIQFLVFLTFTAFVLGQRELEQYNVDMSSISVSGISSGAAMATQFHVAYSHNVKGCGMVAGVPYYCAKNSAIQGTTRCMSNPHLVNVPELISQANQYASQGRISATANLLGSKVFIYHGAKDSVVMPESSDNIYSFYSNFGANIATERTIQGEHGFPTDHYGVPCDQKGGHYINWCNWDGAYNILNHIYGGLSKPTRPIMLPGDFYIFDQSEFFEYNPDLSSMDTQGFVYVPSGCMNRQKTCYLHIVYHGCGQNRQDVGDVFATKTGYNEVGELNDIIMLYPQTIKTPLNGNPYGCWDWWGYLYNYPYYATQGAHQPLGVCRMVEKISGKPMPCP